MPTYTFECGCGARLDVVRPMAEAGKVEACPGCGRGMARVFMAPQVVNESFRKVVLNGSVPGPDPGDPLVPWRLESKGDYKRMKETVKVRDGLEVV